MEAVKLHELLPIPWTTVLTPTASVFKLTGLTSGQRVWVPASLHFISSSHALRPHLIGQAHKPHFPIRALSEICGS